MGILTLEKKDRERGRIDHWAMIEVHEGVKNLEMFIEIFVIYIIACSRD
jgi:hypothetical protein